MNPQAPSGSWIRTDHMDAAEREGEVTGEVIKMIHGELPAVRWACAICGEDNCSIFFEPEANQRTLECEVCGASNVVHKEHDA